MAAPILGYGELVEGQDIPETTVNEMCRYLEQGAGKFTFKDRDLTAPPGSPAQGDCYLVAAAATGAWNLMDGKIAFYMGSAWEFITPKEGFVAWVNDEDTGIVFNGSSWISFGSQPPYYVAFFFTTTPTTSEVLLLHTFAEAITFADEWSGSVGDVGTNPTASFVLTVSKNGSSVGTITISTGGAFTFATTGTTVSFAAGDQMKITGPVTADATVANVSITLRGVR